MHVLAKGIERLALIVLLVGGAGMLASTFLGTADVIGTQMLGQPIAGARELTESTMVLIVFGALTYAQIKRSHIRVEIIYLAVGARAKAAMDVLACVCAIIFFGLLLWQGYAEAMFSTQIGEATVGLVRFPLYPARWILVAGTSLMLLRLVLDLFLDIDRFIKGAEPDFMHIEQQIIAELENKPELVGKPE
ncbi:MAG: TRAP transporter small permease [Microvirga sp.]|nr:TRAP transporter small permease [Microvirga sp.]